MRSPPRSRPVRMATRMPAASASGAMVLRCWRARISVGAMKAACRPASITAAAASSATTVLPEPTSPCSSRNMRCGQREVGDDVVDRLLLRMGQRIGQRLEDARAQAAFAGRAAAGLPAHMRAHQRQRELAGEQFVVGEPRPGQAFRRDVVRLGRPMQMAQRVGEGRKALARDPGLVLPFRQLGQARQRAIHRAPHIAERQALRSADRPARPAADRRSLSRPPRGRDAPSATCRRRIRRCRRRSASRRPAGASPGSPCAR